MKKTLFALSMALLFIGGSLKAQDDYYMTGLLPDDGTYDQLPRKFELLSRDYTALPRKYSLLQYCPEAKSQGSHGTCTSWATSYAARTIAEAVKWGWTDKTKITQESFSPIFVYAQIKTKYDDNCRKGTYIHMALQLLKDKGAPKFSDFNVLCANDIDSKLYESAQNYKIDDYFTLFSYNDNNRNDKIRKVKKSLSENCPVVIAMWLPSTFQSAQRVLNMENVATNFPIKNTEIEGYHAMCVIGYDDDFAGGAFQIMNSWGANWGENGFIWVKYADFARCVDQAYELYLKKSHNIKPNPDPKPNPININDELYGEITLQLSTGEKMSPIFDKDKQIYRIAGEFVSGTRYRIYISNNIPAYVYVIGSDMENHVSKVFPPKDNISAALTYQSNHIAIPDESYYIEFDNTSGTDYMCILFSKDNLDINTIIHQIKNGSGSFYDELTSTITGKTASRNDIQYLLNDIGFHAVTEKTIVPIFVEMKHK